MSKHHAILHCKSTTFFWYQRKKFHNFLINALDLTVSIGSICSLFQTPLRDNLYSVWPRISYLAWPDKAIFAFCGILLWSFAQFCFCFLRQFTLFFALFNMAVDRFLMWKILQFYLFLIDFKPDFWTEGAVRAMSVRTLMAESRLRSAKPLILSRRRPLNSSNLSNPLVLTFV